MEIQYYFKCDCGEYRPSGFWEFDKLQWFLYDNPTPICNCGKEMLNTTIGRPIMKINQRNMLLRRSPLFDVVGVEELSGD